MARIGHIPSILAVKSNLENLKQEGLIKEWEITYENLLTHLTAAIFFFDIEDESRIPSLKEDWSKLVLEHTDVKYRENEEKKLSQLKYRLEFHKPDGAF